MAHQFWINCKFLYYLLDAFYFPTDRAIIRCTTKQLNTLICYFFHLKFAKLLVMGDNGRRSVSEGAALSRIQNSKMQTEASLWEILSQANLLLLGVLLWWVFYCPWWILKHSTKPVRSNKPYDRARGSTADSAAQRALRRPLAPQTLFRDKKQSRIFPKNVNNLSTQ